VSPKCSRRSDANVVVEHAGPGVESMDLAVDEELKPGGRTTVSCVVTDSAMLANPFADTSE